LAVGLLQEKERIEKEAGGKNGEKAYSAEIMSNKRS